MAWALHMVMTPLIQEDQTIESGNGDGHTLSRPGQESTHINPTGTGDQNQLGSVGVVEDRLPPPRPDVDNRLEQPRNQGTSYGPSAHGKLSTI